MNFETVIGLEVRRAQHQFKNLLTTSAHFRK